MSILSEYSGILAIPGILVIRKNGIGNTGRPYQFARKSQDLAEIKTVNPACPVQQHCFK